MGPLGSAAAPSQAAALTGTASSDTDDRRATVLLLLSHWSPTTDRGGADQRSLARLDEAARSLSEIDSAWRFGRGQTGTFPCANVPESGTLVVWASASAPATCTKSSFSR